MRRITTKVGPIAVYLKLGNPSLIPIIFLHGLYFDHHLWDKQVEQINDRTVIALDMPFHGDSHDKIEYSLTLQDCAWMLLEILEALELQRVIAVGHSWGSMTLIRAAHQKPEAFPAMGLCNLRFKAATSLERVLIPLQHTLLVFRNFYFDQTAKSLFSKQSLANQPHLSQFLIASMSKLTNSQIKYIDQVVRIEPQESYELIRNLQVPALAIVGEEDYVGIPPIEQTSIVRGGHTSPMEAPDEVSAMINKLIELIKQ